MNQTKWLISAISALVAVIAIVVAGVLLTTVPRRAPVERAADKGVPGVVRVSVVEGSAVVQRGNSHVQTYAVRNAPMLPGDFISTGNTSRAELQFDGYSAVRLGGNVQARIVENDSIRRVQVADGTVGIGMVRDGSTMQIDTPSVTVRTQTSGDSRISIAQDGSTWVTARRGSVDVVTPQRTYTLGTGSTLVARGSASDPSVTYSPEVAYDSFDDFNAQRDRTMVAALNASPNLNPSIAGYENLNDYGQWQAVAGYGRSWVPNEPAGWVPYRNGSWVWEGGYGWTWIGSEPWGWTPYHYGNWYYCSCGSSGWAWLPPSSAAAPKWSPALVGFFGFDVASTGGGWNNCEGNYSSAPSSSGGGPVATYANAPPAQSAPESAPNNSGGPAPYGQGGPAPENGGGPGGYNYPAAPYGEGGGYSAPYGYSYPYTGWVPIAPYEPFYPWYPFFGGYGYGGFGGGYVNVTNITNITRIYRNFRHGGATGTKTRNFRHGTVSGHTVAVNPRDVGRRVGTIHGALPFKPTRHNLGFSHGTVHAPVKFSKAFDSPRFTLNRALASPASSGRQENAHAVAGRANAPVSRAHLATTHGNASMGHANRAEAHSSAFQPRENPSVTRESAATGRGFEANRRENAPVSRESAATSRGFEGNRRESAPVTRANAASARTFEANRRENAPVSRENGTIMRENGATMRENGATMRENGATMRENGATMPENGEMRNGFAPSTSWNRFNETRGEARSGAFPAGPERGSMGAREGELSAPTEGRREERGPSDSWGRFSDSRGESSEGARNPYSERGSMPSYGRDMPSYGREMPSYSRGPNESPYSRESYPSYSRSPYESPYSRGGYPSYPRESYPSYSHGSYPSYPRGSGGAPPSYSHGSYGAPPSYSHGSYGAPSRPSGGGGGGGGYRGGGGRPPH